jgi:hypothetical protein
MSARGPGRTARNGEVRPVRFARVAFAALLAASMLVTIAGPAGAQAPHPASSLIVAIDQNHPILADGTLNVSMEIASTAGVQLIYYQFCGMTKPVCYTPSITMVENGSSNWYAGSTKPMNQYQGMSYGVAAGYNITIEFTNGTMVHYPTPSSSFPGVTVALAALADEWVFEVVVQNQTFDLQGTVTNSTSGHGLAGATVSLTPGTNTTVTGPTGTYSFPGLFNGTYQLTVSESGYASQELTVQVAGKPVTKNIALSTHGSGPGQGSPPGGGGGSGPLSALTTGTTLYVGIAVVVVVVALAAAWAMRRRPRPRTGSPPDPPPDPPVAGGGGP